MIILLNGQVITVQQITAPSSNNFEWDLVWSDEFDFTGVPDSNKSGYDIGSWGNNAA